MKKLTVSMTDSEIKYGWIYFAVQMTVLQIFLALVNTIFGSPLSVTGLNVVYFVVNFVFSISIFHHFLKVSFRVALKKPFRCIGYAAIGFILYWIASALIGNLFQWIRPGFSNINDDTIVIMLRERPVLIGVGVVLLVPVSEELVFRGLIFRPLYNRSPWLGYGVSVFGFSIIHILGYLGKAEPLVLLLCFIQYLPAAFCLAWAYARSKTIWSPVLIHTTINLISVLIMI